MKKNTCLVLMMFLVFSCAEKAIEKPTNYIEKDKMVAIMCDLSIAQAIQNYKPMDLYNNQIEIRKWIVQKYGVDSATFVANNQYYAGDVKGYKKIFDAVKICLENKKQELKKPIKKS